MSARRPDRHPVAEADLAARVLAWGREVPGMERAARLLVRSGWLADAGFVDTCVITVTGTPPLAVVNWGAAAEFLERDLHGSRRARRRLGRAVRAGRDAWASLRGYSGGLP